MEYTILKVTIKNGVAVAVISRPEAMNALNSEFFLEFNDLLDSVSKNQEIRVLVLTGDGKAFVAGADIAELSDMNRKESFCFSKTGQDAFHRLEKLEIPVIAAVNGYALGGGCELAMACDFRIAGKSAKFGLPEMTLGLIPGYAGTQRLSRLSGLGNALFMILSGEMIMAEDALRMGLAQKVVDDELLMETTLKIAEKIASNGSMAVSTAKELIRKGIENTFKEASKMESEAFSKLFDYPSSKEGLKAFLEKRKPKW